MSEEPVEILLVDDESRNLDALEAVLDDQGYRLLRAEDADLALRVLLEHDVAAIVLDIKMPKVNGIELAQIIKGTKRFRQIPILFLTAHMMEDKDVVAGYGAGAVDYMTKPFNPQILRHKVAVFADLYRKTRALADLNERLEQRVAERTAELQKSEKALLQAARQKDEFLATLAHELRNPLAPLRTGVDLLMQLPSPTNAASRTLAAMNRQLDHLVRLIDDLLDVSRISRGVLEIKKDRTDLVRLVLNTCDTFRPLFEQRQIELMTVVRQQVTGDVDPTRVAQILGNLLHNAAKFTPGGGAVRVTLEHDHGWAVITVTDTGIGIAPDQLARIFEMFARVERVGDGTPDRGAGIGLALAQRLAQLHGGDLTATSSGENRGATFTVRLPGADVAERSDATTPVRGRPAMPRAKMTPLDIVVIEDNEDVAETLVVWLESSGHRVKVAHTGPKGLALALESKPQVVLCDVGLPEMDGLEVCQRVRQASREFRPLMIALTGWGMDEDREKTKAAGFDHHLVKPVSVELLSELLRHAGTVAAKPS
ncbi:MAG TPA: response regulator [Kofleriaceae bacterium]|nr:response regulator [Kofleriaceae bacterium]